MKHPDSGTAVNIKRLVLFITLIVVLAGVSGTIFAPTAPSRAVREIVIVAKDMTFIIDSLESSGAANPTLTVKAGQKVTIVLRNDDPGMQHDLIIQGLQVQVRAVSYGQTTRLTFTVPRESGTYTYLCSFHPRSMRGAFVIE